MTTQRDDIAGLSERLRESPLPSLNRICKDRIEAATQLDSLSARVKELEVQLAAARKSLDQQTQMASEQFCRALRAEQERDALEEQASELRHGVEDQMEDAAYHKERRVEAEARATRAEQERDEAYERAAGVADSHICKEFDDAWIISRGIRNLKAISIAKQNGAEVHPRVKAIRRLASGPEKETK